MRVTCILVLLLAAAAFGQFNVGVTVNRPFVVEGDSSPVVFTFTRDNTTNSLTITLDRTASTASFGTDYVSSFGSGNSLTFPSTVPSVQITISPGDDLTDEPIELVSFAIAAGAGYSVDPDASSAEVLIIDTTTLPNEMTVIADRNQVREDAGETATIYILRSGDPSAGLALNVTDAATNATAGVDYVSNVAFTNGFFRADLGGGLHSFAITIAPVDDDSAETPREVNIRLLDTTATMMSDPAFYTFLNNNATVKIIDDDPSLELIIADPVSGIVTEGGSSQSPPVPQDLTFQLVRTGSTASDVTVYFKLTGTASFGSTYSLSGATATSDPELFQALLSMGSATHSIVVRPQNDGVFISPSTSVIMSLFNSSDSSLFIDTENVLTGTIVDDDGFTVSVTTSALPTTPEDSSSPLAITLTRTGSGLPLTSPLTVNLALGGTASSASDYTLSGASVVVNGMGTGATAVIPAGQPTAVIEMLPTADTVVERDETVIVTVLSGVYIVDSILNEVTLTISNDDKNTVSISILTLDAVNEDQAGASITVQISREIFDPAEVTVSFSVGGTATFGVDYAVEAAGQLSYTTVSGSVVFPENSATFTFTILPIADTLSEADETVVLTLSSGTGYALGNPTEVTGTIVNDDPAQVSVSMSPAEVQEDGVVDITVVFTRVGSTESALDVFFTVSGTADLSDYTPVFGSSGTWIIGSSNVNIPIGASSTIVTLNPSTDSTIEDDETVIVSLDAAAGYTVGTGTAQSVIFNDDGPPTVKLAAATTSVQEGSGTLMAVDFKRSGSPSAKLNVTFNIDGASTATAFDDYTLSGQESFSGTSGVVRIDSGSFVTRVLLTSLDDNRPEDDETVVFVAVDGPGYTAAAAPDDQVTLTIENDDPNVSVRIIGLSSQSEANVVGFTFQFTRNNNTGALDVELSLSGTATPNTDYELSTLADAITSGFPNSPSVAFADGQTTLDWTLNLLDDTTPEPDETIIVTILPTNDYVPSSTMGSATAIIVNDDGAFVSLSVNPSSVAEGTPNVFSPTPATLVTYTFTREGSLTNTLTVGFDVSDSTATFGQDFTESGALSFSSSFGTIRFPIGASVFELVLTVIDDVEVEGTEEIVLQLTNGAGYQPQTLTPVVCTITSDDGNVVTVSASPNRVLEDANPTESITFTFRRDGQTSEAIEVEFSVGGSATFSVDYDVSGAQSFSTGSGSVTIARSSRTASIIVTPRADATDEPDETVVLTILANDAYLVGNEGSASATISEVNLNADAMTLFVNTDTLLDSSENVILFTFRRLEPAPSDVVINFVVSGSAVQNIDYVATSLSSADLDFVDSSSVRSSITLRSGAQSVDLTVDPLDIQVNQVTITLTITDPLIPNTYTIDSPSSQTSSIVNDQSGVTPGTVFDTLNGNLYYIRIIHMCATFDNDDGEADEEVPDYVLRELLGDYLQISISFLAVAENYGDTAIIAISGVPGGETASAIGIDIVTAINSRVADFQDTALECALGILVGTELPQTPEVLAVVPDFNLLDLQNDYVVTVSAVVYEDGGNSGMSLVPFLFSSILAIIAATL